MRWRLTLSILAVTPAVAVAEPLDTREQSLRETAYEPVYEIERADLRFSWRADAAGATESSFFGGTSTTLATGSVGAELAVSHAACDLLVAGGQADVRSGESPVSFQQWASFCPLSGDIRITLEHHLAYDVRARLLAPPRQRPGEQRMETISFDMAGIRERTNDPGPLSLAPPPPEWIAFMLARLDVGVGWQDQPPGSASSSVDMQAKQEMYGFGYQKARADGGPPLDLWIFGARGVVLTHGSASEVQVAMTARMDAFKLKNARLAGLRVGGDLGIAMGVASDGRDTRVGSMMTPVAAVTVERDLVRKADEATVSAQLIRDVWPLWDGRVVIDDRATLGYGHRHKKLRLRGEVSGGRSHLLAHDNTLTAGNTGGLTTIAEYEVNRHLTVRSRNELGWSVYAAGATVDAPIRAVEAMVTAVVHTGNR